MGKYIKIANLKNLHTIKRSFGLRYTKLEWRASVLVFDFAENWVLQSSQFILLH